MNDRTRIDRQINLARADFRRAYLDMVKQMRRRVSLVQIRRMLAEGRVDDLLGLVRRQATGIATAWSDAYVRAGKSIATHISGRFDPFAERAARRIRQHQQAMLREFAEEQVDAARAALVEGLRTGANAPRQAKLLRESFGLAPYHRQAVSNYRRLLEQGGAQAVSRTLRDRRFDSTARRGELTTIQVERMTERYRQRMVLYRAGVLAETEGRSVVFEATEEAYQQSIEAGDVDQSGLARQWITRGDGHVRGSHISMHGQIRPFGEPFISGNGFALRHPGDPNAPASDRINCRCRLITTVAPEPELQQIPENAENPPIL